MGMILRRSLTACALSITLIAAPLVANAAGADDLVYEIQPGDSLYGIAESHDISVASLLRVNDLTLTSVILPGQQLRLPEGATSPAASPEPSAPAATGGSHLVVWGDSLSGIAARYGVSLSSLLSVNDLQVSSLILPGRELRLPEGAAVPTPAVETPTVTVPTTPTTTADTTTGGTHIVVWGDSLSGIAGRYGVSLSSLLSLNDLRADSLIVPGRSLRLPAGATASATDTSEHEGIQKVLAYASAQVGKPYRFFTRGPDTFDCSGLVLAAYAQVGVNLIHYSAAQAVQGTAVDFEHEAIQPGDLVFLKRRGSETINHVGIAVSEHVWIQATGPGDIVRSGPMPATDTISAVRRYLD